jgi:hypothetical protein
VSNNEEREKKKEKKAMRMAYTRTKLNRSYSDPTLCRFMCTVFQK